MKVPFLDLQAPYRAMKDEIGRAIDSVLDSSAFAGGPFVAKFEGEFAAFCGARHALGVGSGTDALWLTLLAMGIGPGDEVITVPSTFIATSEAISFCGARPVFVDIDPRAYTMNPDCVEKAITPRTKALIPVHLFGQMADMDPILAIARRHGLLVVEDACQAHGAGYKNRMAGTMGHAGCFSFYPGKNLGAYGEAGAVITQDEELAAKIRMLRDHGQAQKYIHRLVGWNGRMDGLQGAVLSVKLKHLSAANESRRACARLYGELLSDVEEVALPEEADYSKHVYHIFAVRVQNRDEVMRQLAEKGISCGIHYPVPLHLQEAYAWLGWRRGAFPVAEQCATEFLSLPMYPELKAEQIEYVSEQLAAIVKDASHELAMAGNVG
ncbi:MAG: DegT/DnrJ/EryC1/StrS family aminotransferase [Kiritimatiellia bacterium]